MTHSPIVDKDYGSVLTCKGPDGIQFECSPGRTTRSGYRLLGRELA